MQRPYISLQQILHDAHLGTGKIYVEYKSDRCDPQLYIFDDIHHMKTFFSLHHGTSTGIHEYRGVPIQDINLVVEESRVYIDDDDEVYTFSSTEHAESFLTLFKSSI